MLALRAEKAFGLTMVQRPRAGGNVEAAETSEVAEIAENHGESAAFVNPRAAKRKTAPLPIIAPSVPITVPELDVSEKRVRLAALDSGEVKGCTRCGLCETRTNTVFGEGDSNARLMFIGEGPGENEDLQARPFVGRSGDLLTKQIGAMGLRRDQVFIANVVKCRPPGNRTPTPDEAATCQPYLERQIEIIRPRVIVTLGLTSSQYLLQMKTTMRQMRGVWHAYRGIKVMPTFHPAYILRSYTREVREAVWSDLQKVMEELRLFESET